MPTRKRDGRQRWRPLARRAQDRSDDRSGREDGKSRFSILPAKMQPRERAAQGWTNMPENAVTRNEGPIEEPGRVVDVERMLTRFQQIMDAHRDAPEQQRDEHRYRDLAARLLRERQELAEELREAGIPDDEAEREFERRNAAITRFATVWDAEDPETARRRTNLTEQTPDEPPRAVQQAVMNTLPW